MWTTYPSISIFRAKLQLVTDPLTLCTFFPHEFRVEVPFHRQATYFYQLNYHRQAGQRAFVLDIRKIPTLSQCIMSASALRESCFAFRAALTSAPNVSKPGQSSIFAILYHPYTFYSSWAAHGMLQNPFVLHFILHTHALLLVAQPYIMRLDRSLQEKRHVSRFNYQRKSLHREVSVTFG